MQLKKKEKLYWVRLAKNKGVIWAKNQYIKKYNHLYNYKCEKNYHKKIAKLIRIWIKLYNSGGMKELKSKTGTTKGSGRPKKPIPAKIIWEKLNENEKFEIFKDWLEQEREKPKSKKMQTQSKFSNEIKQIRRLEIWQLSKQGIKLFNDRGFSNENKKPKALEISKKIIEIAIKNQRTIRGKKIFIDGREKIANDLKSLYGIDLSPRNVGIHMSKNGVNSVIRQKSKYSKKKELKDVEQITENLTNRDYRKPNTYSLDVKYIPHKHASGNHIFIRAYNSLRV